MPPPPHVKVESQEEWEVQEVLDSRPYVRQLQFLVKWLGWDTATWQPVDDLGNSAGEVEHFQPLHFTRSGPW